MDPGLQDGGLAPSGLGNCPFAEARKLLQQAHKKRGADRIRLESGE